MNKYYFIYLVWLLPAYFLFQLSYQSLNFYSVNKTYIEGESYVATVIDFDIKQIAAQSNGYVVLRFNDSDGNQIEEKLSLPVQFAQVIMDHEVIPVRYDATSFREIVMIPVFELQKKVILVNIAVTIFGFIATLIVSIYASKYVRRKVKFGDEIVEYERIDGVE